MTCLQCNSRKSKCSDAVRPPRHLNVPTTCRRRRWPTAAEAQNNENRDTNCTSQDLQWHSKATLTQGKNGRRAPWIKGISQNEHSKVPISFQGAHLWGKKKFFRTFKTVWGFPSLLQNNAQGICLNSLYSKEWPRKLRNSNSTVKQGQFRAPGDRKNRQYTVQLSCQLHSVKLSNHMVLSSLALFDTHSTSDM